jgi:hypothetical protein
MPDSERPTDPFERLGLVAGSVESMQKVGRAAKDLDRWRKGITDPHVARLAKEVSEQHHRQIGIYNLVAKVLSRYEKQKAPIGLWGHLKAWWAERG